MALLTAIAAPPGAGKTALGEALASDWGFTRITGSEVIRQAHAAWDPETRGELTEREDLLRFYGLMTKERGFGSIAATVLDIMKTAREDLRVCYDGVRNRHDARRIAEGGGIIVALDCPAGIRHLRFNEREGKNLTFEEFTKMEAYEYESPKEDGLHLREVMDSARIRIDANQPLEKVTSDFIAALRGIGIALD